MFYTRAVFAPQLWRYGILVLLALVLAGCSGIGVPIKAYDGADLSESQLATLEVPSNIKVVSINGEDMTSFLLEDLALDYNLKPGPNTVVFRYRSIWSRNEVRENDESAVETVESGLSQVSFDATAGETYSFAFAEADNVREARRLAQNFNPRLVSVSGQTIMRAAPYSREQQAVQAPSGEMGQIESTETRRNQGAAEVAPASAASVAPNMSTLEALNLLWTRATREEKEEFLRQAFD